MYAVDNNKISIISGSYSGYKKIQILKPLAEVGALPVLLCSNNINMTDRNYFELEYFWGVIIPFSLEPEVIGLIESKNQ